MPTRLMRLIFLTVFILFSMNLSAQSDDELIVTGISTGAEPRCMNVNYARDNSLTNFLKVNVGGGSDVVLRLIRKSNDECIRSVFIAAGESHSLINIPAGVYYLKIAFGNDWAEAGDKGNCKAGFLNNPDFKEGTELLDFTPIVTGNGIQLPSYELILELVSSNRSNEFNTERISEEEFFK